VQRLLLVLLVAVSYLLFAGGLPWTLVPLLAMAGGGALLTSRRSFAQLRPWRSLDLALVALLVALVVQIAPLPAAVVAWLSPYRDGIANATRLRSFVDPGSAWSTLSVDPSATLAALATVAIGVLTFWTARASFSAGGSTRSFCRALTFFGLIAAASAVVQKMVAPRSVLFLIEAGDGSASPLGAFVNRNHFGAWLLMVGAPVGGYLVARTRIHPLRRNRWGGSIGQIMSSGIVFTAIAVMVIAGVLLLTFSRSAMAGVGVAAIVAWRLGQPRMNLERTSLPTRLGVAGALLLIVVLFVDVERWATRVAESFETTATPLGRLTIWQESIPIVRDFWLTGTGAGTFSDAMIVYQESRVWVGSMRRWAHFNNAHSHYLQVLCEGGLLLAVPSLWALGALALLGYRAVRSDKGEMFWVRVGAAAGLAGLAAQSVWETSLIMPANAVMAGVLGGLLLYRREAPPEPAPMMSPARITIA
jgi:putative inorganic carbon (hco3(-)) transporter